MTLTDADLERIKERNESRAQTDQASDLPAGTAVAMAEEILWMRARLRPYRENQRASNAKTMNY